MNDAVRVERFDQVTLVTLDREAARNAVDAGTARALYDAFLAFEQDAQARVAVFHGAHGHFCAGWDLRAGARQAGEASGALAAKQMAEALAFDANDPAPLGAMGPSRLLLAKPVIAAVSGAAVAGGMELALWCDLRVMEQDAYFGVYCRRFGVPLIDGGTVRLPRLIGMGHAMDLILTGRRVDADEALRIGLCNRVVPHGTARDAALALARQLAAFPQGALRADRLSAHAQWGLPLASALQQEWERGRHCIA
ncbi:MAG: enoyl-CoA hydratase [Burkholderiaceae bacterium]|jgi:enoyl-CoA hydratase|nr:MAG: enoyl-CoA hydratase [Burkholderiaceae bacterium]